MKKRIWALACTILLLLASCGETASETAHLAPGEEERLVVYTSHKEEVYGPVIKEFEERTGIWVEVVTGGTGELLDRIAREKENPGCDVMFGGGVESLQLYEDCFEPYAGSGSELLKSGLRPQGDRWTPFSSLPVVLIYNTRLVSPGELTSWAGLLEERWRGKIAFADPAVSGSSYTAAITMLLCLEGDIWDNLARFENNLDGNIIEDSGDVVTAVDTGSCWVGVTLEETALKRIAAGDDVALIYPSSGTSCVPDASALIQGAPHEDNAKQFLDFTVSPEVQRLLTEQFCRRSVRGDIPSDLTPLEDIPLVDYHVEQASLDRDAILMTWAFYLGGEGET